MEGLRSWLWGHVRFVEDVHEHIEVHRKEPSGLDDPRVPKMAVIPRRVIN
jgi:hypothetical protein